VVRTEHDIEAALATLVPDPAADASVIEAVHRKIARRRTIAWTTAVGTSAAAIGVAASLVLAIAPSAGHQPTGVHRTGGHGTPVSAPVELRTLAKVAAIQPKFHKPRPGQFWYYETREGGGKCIKAINPHLGHDYLQNCYIHTQEVDKSQVWIASDGSGRMLNIPLSARLASARDRARWIAAGRPSLDARRENLTYRKHELSVTIPGLGKLPTNPAKLAKVIHDRKWEGGDPGPAEDFTQVGDLLRTANASPALRSAAFEVGAGIPGVKSLGVVTFHGVTGAAIAFTLPHTAAYKGGDGRSELIFDRTTSLLKAEVNTVFRGSKVLDLSWVTYPSSGLVNSLHSTPGQ
jgi:hypothetical protein